MGIQILSTADSERWDKIVLSFEKYDIYYMCGYAKTVSFQIPGEPFLLYYEGERMRAINVVIKRDIAEDTNFSGKLEKGRYFDLVAPYGYGGWLTEGEDERADLFRQYSSWCRESNIISEFVRLHPIFDNHSVYGDDYEIIYSRHTVGTNLSDYDDPVQAEFSKSVRRDVRRSQAAGVKCTVIEAPDNWKVFRTLYEETMDRNGADSEYYFPDAYYEQITSSLRPYTIEIRAEAEDGEVIGSEMYFTAGKLMHAHLLGSSHRLNELHAGALLEATAAAWGHEHGYKYIHHGGGRTSDEEDALYQYKKKFGKNTEFDFYCGKKIWDEDKYKMLMEIRGLSENDSTYFPVYRM